MNLIYLNIFRFEASLKAKLPEKELPIEGVNAMNNTTTDLGQAEEAILTCEVSDEALETAAGQDKAGNYTLAYCSGLSVCPA